MTVRPFPPPSLRRLNKVVIGLQRLGLAVGTMHLLTVAGRKSGVARTTPVSPYDVNGKRYIVGGYGSSDWVKNARAAGEGVLSRGRHQERVRLVELPVEERGAILREFPAKVPHGVGMFMKTGSVDSATPQGFEDAAPRCPVFRVEPL
ncbi:MAG TPA: nitroreductase family deazaflavin-dependent oxidoreductase [Actinopolymorphaceae bacterium]|nr:nitroreductase family deazaflavin-dependent oxidoreductase [Actinopolymorphaceae bacterium]